MAAAGRAWPAGIAFGLTVLTRSTVTLAVPLALWMLVRPVAESAAPRRRWITAAIALGVPIAVASGIHAVYNLARFGSVADAGYHYILMGDVFQALVDQYGRFSTHFLVPNLTNLLARLPLFEAGRLVPDPHGMSVLLTTPYLLLALVPRRVSAMEIVAILTAVVIAVPALLYYNDGWVQFGQRFALDWMAPGLLVASFGARRTPLWVVVALAAIGIAVNAWGLSWFSANFLH